MDNNYYLIEVNKLTKYYRRKNLYINHKHFLVDIIQELPFGKIKVNLFYNDKYFPYCYANYIGTTIIEKKDLKIADKNLYK